MKSAPPYTAKFLNGEPIPNRGRGLARYGGGRVVGGRSSRSSKLEGKPAGPGFESRRPHNCLSCYIDDANAMLKSSHVKPVM